MLGSIAGVALLPSEGYRAASVLVSLLDVIVLIVLTWWIRSRLAATLPPTKAPPERSLIFVVIAALTWGMFDAFVA
ncbi:MAG: hypothetical protein ACREUP_10325, partial [Burkholderiales bacterium]